MADSEVDLLVVLGGGYGERFDATQRPHAYYLAQHLTRNGVSPDDIVGFAEGSNTVEEAVLAFRTLEGCRAMRVFVIASHFHCERAEMIFKHVFPA